MPYWVHASNCEPITGFAFTLKTDAIACRTENPLHFPDGRIACTAECTITFIASGNEVQVWQDRELSRFDDRTYIQVPWIDRSFAHDLRLARHFAHLSLKTPGKIAYTPTDEMGVHDRQLTVKPGKYLKEFAGDRLTDQQIEEWTARCREITTGVQIATTAADIERVYRSGPGSCMDEDHARNFQCDGHYPTDVYGDSDLAIAYLGSLDKASARAIVWPARMLYNRTYGDSAIETILKTAGYTYASNFHGAKIRKIALDRSRYVMAYLDCGSGVRSAGSDHWEIAASGEYRCTTTNGVIGTSYSCGHCGDEMDDDDEPYCSSCMDNYARCENCDQESFSPDAFYYHADRTFCRSCYEDCWTCHACDHEGIDRSDAIEIDSEMYCDDCAAEHAHECPGCDETYHTTDKPTAVEISAGTDRLCDDCAKDNRQCRHCDHVYDVAIGAECPACHKFPRCTYTRDLFVSTDAIMVALAAGDTADRVAATAF